MLRFFGFSLIHVFLNLSSSIHVLAYLDYSSLFANLFAISCHTILMLAHVSSSNCLPHLVIPRRLWIFIEHLASFPRGSCHVKTACRAIPWKHLYLKYPNLPSWWFSSRPLTPPIFATSLRSWRNHLLESLGPGTKSILSLVAFLA